MMFHARLKGDDDKEGSLIEADDQESAAVKYLEGHDSEWQVDFVEQGAVVVETKPVQSNEWSSQTVYAEAQIVFWTD